jgi:hypothetical protein
MSKDVVMHHRCRRAMGERVGEGPADDAAWETGTDAGWTLIFV